MSALYVMIVQGADHFPVLKPVTRPCPRLKLSPLWQLKTSAPDKVPALAPAPVPALVPALALAPVPDLVPDLGQAQAVVVLPAVQAVLPGAQVRELPAPTPVHPLSRPRALQSALSAHNLSSVSQWELLRPSCSCKIDTEPGVRRETWGPMMHICDTIFDVELSWF